MTIELNDWAAPSQRLTYGIVTSALRGVALFGSLYGYVEMDVDVMDGEWGMVGTAKVEAGVAPAGAQSRRAPQDRGASAGNEED